ncbi:trypsin-like serine protease [bacterium]|nr:trypsin-like serine protease [bacterium]
MKRITLAAIIFFSCFSSICAEKPKREKEDFYSQITRAIIRLEHTQKIKYEGSEDVKAVNKSNGTAFFVARGKELFVVSARHVVEKEYDLHARVQTKNKITNEKETVILKLPRDRWVFHPNNGDKNTHYVDVAAMKIKWIKDHSVKHFRYESEESVEKDRNQLPTDDPMPPRSVLVFGFPSNIGFKLLVQKPFGRLGIVSMQTGQKCLRVNYLNIGNKFAEERCCVVDVEAFPGNSGSPIINQFNSVFDPKIKLLGLLVAADNKMDFAIMEPVSRIREVLDIAKEKSNEDVNFWSSLKSKN